MLRLVQNKLLTLGTLVCGLLPQHALAEVSDKTPKIGLIWLVSLVAALLCVAAARFKPWLGLLSFLPAALWFASLFLEIYSPDLRPSLLREKGSSYYWQAYAAFGTVLCGLLLGFRWHKHGNLHRVSKR